MNDWEVIAIDSGKLIKCIVSGCYSIQDVIYRLNGRFNTNNIIQIKRVEEVIFQ